MYRMPAEICPITRDNPRLFHDELAYSRMLQFCNFIKDELAYYRYCLFFILFYWIIKEKNG